MRIFVPLSALLLLAACNREAPDCGAQGADGCGRSVEETATAAVPEEAPSATATPAAPLDKSALNERKQPSRVLGYLAEAVNAGNWPDAALAWLREQPSHAPRTDRIFSSAVSICFRNEASVR